MQLSPLALPGDRDKDYTKYGSFRAALFVCEKKYSTQILPRYDISEHYSQIQPSNRKYV